MFFNFQKDWTQIISIDIVIASTVIVFTVIASTVIASTVIASTVFASTSSPLPLSPLPLSLLPLSRLQIRSSSPQLLTHLLLSPISIRSNLKVKIILFSVIIITKHFWFNCLVSNVLFLFLRVEIYRNLLLPQYPLPILQLLI